MLQKEFKFVLGHGESQVVCRVYHEYDRLRLRVIVLPKGAISALAGHVEDCEVDLVALEGLHLETHGRRKLLLLVLLRFQVVDHCGFARVV